MVNGEDPVAAARRMWMDAVNQGALEEYVEQVSENVVWLPPAGEPIVGRAAFRAWLEPFFERFDYRFSVEPTWVRAWKGWCAEHGRFHSELSPRSGGEAKVHGGHYFVLWRQNQDGAWRIERYVHGIGAGGHST